MKHWKAVCCRTANSAPQHQEEHQFHKRLLNSKDKLHIIKSGSHHYTSSYYILIIFEGSCVHLSHLSPSHPAQWSFCTADMHDSLCHCVIDHRGLILFSSQRMADITTCFAVMPHCLMCALCSLLPMTPNG